MTTDWHSRWEEGRTGFHLPQVNPALERHLHRLADGPAEILVPLCGKTLDLKFLAHSGHKPIGVELVEKAVADFFAEHGLDAEQDHSHGYALWSGGGVDIHVVDIFAATGVAPQSVDAVWDRAALIALSPGDRERYVECVLRAMRPGGRLLLVTLAYDQTLMDGPPFSVPDDEVQRLLGSRGKLERLEQDPVEAHPRLAETGAVFTESVWLLTV